MAWRLRPSSSVEVEREGAAIEEIRPIGMGFVSALDMSLRIVGSCSMISTNETVSGLMRMPSPLALKERSVSRTVVEGVASEEAWLTGLRVMKVLETWFWIVERCIMVSMKEPVSIIMRIAVS